MPLKLAFYETVNDKTLTDSRKPPPPQDTVGADTSSEKGGKGGKGSGKGSKPAQAAKPAAAPTPNYTGTADTQSLQRYQFRSFLLRLFYYAKIWCALKRIDYNEDNQLQFDEFSEEAHSLSHDLQLDLEPSREQFDEIRNYGGATKENIEFNQLCAWYTVNQNDDALSELLQVVRTQFTRKCVST